MITPSYSPTATERVLPRLALDFTTGILDSRVTVSRALNTATRVNSSGFIEGINANLPRFDYDPVTLAPKGLLIEEARTNILPYSQEFTNPSWVKESSAVLTNVASTSPNGGATVDEYTVTNSATGFNRVSFPATTTSSTAYSFSIYIKANGWNYFLLRTPINGSNSNIAFDLSSGATTYVAAGFTAFITPFNNGWYRIGFTVTSGSTNGQVFMRFQPTATTDNTISQVTGDGVSGGFMFGAQLEAGAFPTSYIPTTTTSLTRNADVVSMTGTNFSDWYNASEGTLVCGFIPREIGGASFPYTIDNGSANERILTATNITNALQVRDNNIVQAQLNAGGFTVGVQNKVAAAFKENSFAAAINGNATVTDATGTIPTVDRLTLGSGSTGSTYINSHMQSFRFFPQRLTNSEVQAFSK